MKIISLLLVLLFSASVIPASAQIGPSGVGFVNGYFIGPDVFLVGADLSGADLGGANLSDANLSGADLSNAKLIGANLSGVTLTGVSSGGIIGPPSLPAGYQLVNGYIVGPNVDLSGADLSGAILFGANLSGADLGGADLTGAILIGANLSGADLTGAILNEVQLPQLITGASKGNYEEIQTLQTSDTANTAAIATNTAEIEAIKAQLATLVDALAAKDAQIEQQTLRIAEVEAQRDARPTQAQLATVEAERDAKFTEAQIRAMSADPTAGLNDEGNVQVDISFIHSSDLVNFQPFTLTPEMMSVADGKLRMQFPPMDQEAFFYRLGIE